MGEAQTCEGLFDGTRQESSVKTESLLWLKRTVVQFRNGNLLYALLFVRDGA